MDWFPVSDRILYDASKDSPLIVDVGGGKGHDLQIFHEKFPGHGKLILQDLPHVLKQAEDLDSIVECLGYDFFTPQPIHGDYLPTVFGNLPLTLDQVRGYTSITTFFTIGQITNAWRFLKV